MKKLLKNYAFIDSQNLNLGIQKDGWKLDWKKFRVHLKDKYFVSKAYVFLGFIEGNENLYRSLQEYGYIIIFKELLSTSIDVAKIKGNCDAELVLQAMIEYNNYNKAVIVTGDGDFTCLIKYWKLHEKLEKVLIPHKNTAAVLLKKHASFFLVCMQDLRKKLEYKKPPEGRNLKRNF